MVTAQKRTLFVIQSFTKGADEIYQLIAAAASDAHLSSVRADSLESAGSITAEIEKHLSAAAVIVADVTNATPNVMYELGLARAKGRPLILVASSSRDIPFDLAGLRVVIFDRTSPGDFLSRLSAAIKEALKQPRHFRTERPTTQRRQQVFISYSHSDTEYLDRLLVHLKPLEKRSLLELWVDTRLRAGDKWKREIEKALQRATVAVLLVSADFLASDFITDNELPPLLKNAEEQGTRVIPIIVKPCGFTRDKSLKSFQAVNDPKKALILLPAGLQEAIYDQVASEIEGWLQKG
ncbi:MAG: toll/interleukin-1 receptor domain-containing protein [Vicinamibacterales bacterium]